jgi:small basic protein (TIGR04137 family)
MTQHPSFTRNSGGAAKKRSVLKRYERVDLLTKRGVWTETRSVVGLPKTKPEE